MKTFRIISLCAFAAAAFFQAGAQNNIAEEVVWWVGDEPIYKSEVEEMYQTLIYERSDINGDPYCVIPERLAVEKLYVHQAELDSITVQDAMVAQQVDRRIAIMINNLGSQEKLEEFYRRPMAEIRSTMIDAMRNNYLVSEVQASLTKGIKVTPSDVRRYFNTLSADSIPFVPMQVEAQIIAIKPIVPREEIDEVKARLRDFSDRITKGEADFSTLAILYSEDPGSAVRGGELGFSGKGQFVPEFSAVAFNLNDPKKVSKIVETEYGFHIIQLIEKRGDRINCRHILLRPRVSDKDLTDAIHRLDTIRSEIMAEKVPFDEAVRLYSQDKDTRMSRGMMVNDNNGTTRFEMEQLPQEVSRQISSMKVGEVSKPFIMKDPKRNTDMVAIVKLSARIDGHRANMSDDYQMIKDMYESAQREKILTNWVESKIADTYIRIEDGWRNCEFEHKGWVKTAAN